MMSNIKSKSKIKESDISKIKQPKKPKKSLQSSEGQFVGKESTRTITPQIETKQPITPPSTQQKSIVTKTIDRKVVEIQKQEDARKTELISLAKKNGPLMANVIELICSRELSETNFKILKKDLEILLKSNSEQHIIDKANEEIEEIFSPLWKDRSQFIISSLLDDNDKFNKKMLGLVKDYLFNSFQGQTKIRKVDTILLQQLEAFQNPEFIMLLNHIGEPGKNLAKNSPERKQIESVVRGTLGLSEDTILTATHSKQAVLSAILAHHRQTYFTGSCFATCLAIMVHDQNPLELAIELKQIIEKGEFNKVIDGEIQNFPIPKIYLPKRWQVYFSYEDPKEFFNRREIKVLLEKSGLDITHQKDELILMDIFEEISKLPEMMYGGIPAAIHMMPNLIHRLAMHKARLENIDFEQRAEYEKLILEKSEINRKLMEAADEDESKLLLDQLHALIIKMDKLAQGFDKKFGVGSSMGDRFETFEDFKQELEMTFFGAVGENLLLKSWEYAIGSRGRGGNKSYEAMFHNLLMGEDPLLIHKDYFAKPEKSWLGKLWDSAALLNDLIGGAESEFTQMRDEKIMRDMAKIAAQGTDISHILDEVLEAIEDPQGTIDKEKFKKEFCKIFDQNLSRRLGVQYEAGFFRFYDKTRATSKNLEIPLDTPEAIAESIFLIACETIESIKMDPYIRNQIIENLDFAIQGDPNAPSEFIKNLLISYAVYGRIFHSIDLFDILNKSELDLAQLKQRFTEALEGGFIDYHFKHYTGKNFEVKELPNDPKSFIINMVAQLDKMIKNNQLSPINPNNEIMFAMHNIHHAFILRPDMIMLAELMKDPNSNAISDWIEKTFEKEGAFFIVADTNWPAANDLHTFMVIRKNKSTNRLEFALMDEHGQDVLYNVLNFENFKVLFAEQLNS